MEKQIVRTSMLIALMLIVASTSAEEAEKPPRVTEVTFSVSEVSFDPQFSANTRIGRQANKLEISASTTVGRFVFVGAGAGWVFLDDHARLNVKVEPVDTPGAVRTAKSDETAGLLDVFAGLRFPAGRKFSMHIALGHEEIRFGRDINNCIDCPTQKVRIDAGSYYDVGLTFGSKWRVTLARRTYEDESDLEPYLLLGASKAF